MRRILPDAEECEGIRTDEFGRDDKKLHTLIISNLWLLTKKFVSGDLIGFFVEVFICSLCDE